MWCVYIRRKKKKNEDNQPIMLSIILTTMLNILSTLTQAIEKNIERLNLVNLNAIELQENVSDLEKRVNALYDPPPVV